MWAEATEFRRHTLDAHSIHNACAVVDVNRDGRLDVVSGAWWYEAPTWQRHFVRGVEMIRGRYDDYAHLPFDVDRDGWTDLISANYRSQSIYWVQHPGDSLGTWKTHVVDRPGSMETGRLADVDGDGQMDLLPNGLKFAAWWEVTYADNQATWIRHDLPREIAGHGVGFGDINGDGRGDVIGPTGWLEAPVDRRRDRWVYHGDFELGPGCSVPILVHDVDGDGDGDLIWGRGHSIGIYWLEQRRDDGVTSWVHHAIDTSWSQPHSILLADIDQDGGLELVAGKRYMGHDGKDPGEYDPFVLYWYQFDSELRTWSRHAIAAGGQAGFGLDPKAVDLDSDGDIDIVSADRNGLNWFENRLGETDDEAAQSIPVYDDHTRVLYYLDRSGEHAVTNPAELAVRRSHIVAGLEAAMGPLPDSSSRVPLDIEIDSVEDAGTYLRQRITFAADSEGRVPAYLLIPKKLSRPAPAMLCLHQTTAAGKGSPAGLDGRPTLHYAHELAERGYVCVVPDYPSFGDYDYEFDHSKTYRSGSMKAIWNNIRAIDVLDTRADVDRQRIGCIGHSLGGHNGLFTAVFDQRIRAVITSCGFTAFHDYYDGDLAGWTSSRYMPRIRERYGNDPDRVPFDFHEVLAAIAPRSIFVNAPQFDKNFALTGVKSVVSEAQKAFAIRSATTQLQVVYPAEGHDFPDRVRAASYVWLDQQFGQRE